MEEITTTTRHLSVAHFHYTVIIATVSYQYCSYLYYCDIHQRRYICFYCPLAYNGSVILIIFYYKLSQNFAFLTNIEYVHLCYFWTQQFRSRQRNSLLLILILNNKCRDRVPVITQSNHWKKKYYRGSDDFCEGYLDLYLNCLASGNLQQYTTVPSQCEIFPWTWSCCLLYFDHWSHFGKLPGSV